MADASDLTANQKDIEIVEITEVAIETEPKVAVITGASSGIGRATAVEFARQGYNVVLAARRNDALLDVAAECREEGVQAATVVADVTDEAAVINIGDNAVATFGRIDVWVNDAAVMLYGKFEEVPLDEFEQVIDTNLFGYVHGARVALKQFKLQGYGTLINIDSVNAVAPLPYTSAYNISKYAVRGLSHSLRMELELDGLSETIHVCNVMPASVDTNLFQNAANYTGREVRALEPVYDPKYVAKQIVKLADDPKREVIVGPAGRLMAAEFSFLPKLYERAMSRFGNRNNLGREPALDTTGNLYEPVKGNDGIYGGWREKRVRADMLNAVLGVAAAGVVGLIGAGLWKARRRQHHH